MNNLRNSTCKWPTVIQRVLCVIVIMITRFCFDLCFLVCDNVFYVTISRAEDYKLDLSFSLLLVRELRSQVDVGVTGRKDEECEIGFSISILGNSVCIYFKGSTWYSPATLMLFKEMLSEKHLQDWTKMFIIALFIVTKAI